MSLLINVGMWLERFVIIVTALAKEYDPYSWGTYTPSLVEIGVFGGMVSYGVIVFSLSYRYLPLYPGLRQKAKT